jgi:hypothetical protein
MIPDLRKSTGCGLKQTRMTETLLQTLTAHHRAIEAGVEEIRVHCDRAEPDLTALSMARVRLSRLSMKRSQFVKDVVCPRLSEVGPSLHAELADLQAAFNAKRLASSKHVATWSSQAIASDWAGYRQASSQIRAMMKEQIRREEKVLVERLRRKGL